MKDKSIKDFSISKETFQLVYDKQYKMFRTQFDYSKSIESYYESLDYISHSDETNNLFEKIYQTVKKYSIHKKWYWINKLSNSYQSVLDIGCGTGEFLKYGVNHLHKNGIGVEPNTKARQIAKEKNISVFSSIHEIQSQKFDIITLWHVLEHVSNLDEYFTFFKNYLNKNGSLIIAVPNYNSYDAQHYNQYWAAWDVPRHLWHFSKESLPLLMQKYHFHLKEIKPMWFDSYYVSLLSEQYKHGKKRWISAIIHGSISNLKAIFTKEYSSLIYVFEKNE